MTPLIMSWSLAAEMTLGGQLERLEAVHRRRAAQPQSLSIVTCQPVASSATLQIELYPSIVEREPLRVARRSAGLDHSIVAVAWRRGATRIRPAVQHIAVAVALDRLDPVWQYVGWLQSSKAVYSCRRRQSADICREVKCPTGHRHSTERRRRHRTMAQGDVACAARRSANRELPSGYLKVVVLHNGDFSDDVLRARIYGQAPCVAIHFAGEEHTPLSQIPGALYGYTVRLELWSVSRNYREGPEAAIGSPIPTEASRDPSVVKIHGALKKLLAGQDLGQPGIEVRGSIHNADALAELTRPSDIDV
jgi:phage gp37-like protein